MSPENFNPKITPEDRTELEELVKDMSDADISPLNEDRAEILELIKNVKNADIRPLEDDPEPEITKDDRDDVLEILNS